MPRGPLASAGGGIRTGCDDRGLSQSTTEGCPRLTPRIHPCKGSISLSFIDLVNRPTLTVFSHPVNLSTAHGYLLRQCGCLIVWCLLPATNYDKLSGLSNDSS